jgi:hypothetical protein
VRPYVAPPDPGAAHGEVLTIGSQQIQLAASGAQTLTAAQWNARGWTAAAIDRIFAAGVTSIIVTGGGAYNSASAAK